MKVLGRERRLSDMGMSVRAVVSVYLVIRQTIWLPKRPMAVPMITSVG